MDDQNQKKINIFNTPMLPNESVFNVPKQAASTPFIQKEPRRNKIDDYKNILLKNVSNPLWISVSEAAKFGGVTTKTIRRAIQTEKIAYKIIKNRYLIDFRSTILYLHTKTKLKNKLNEFGIGQYIKKWR
ncbi:hypothetical protein A2331_06580 [Candidatus Falkowbacteria bacterium RIFOXYB2_FULL_34_18]|uniref:Helix-turn-helix domain-containing protein n=1 Tax=Candidatus Falkowbacteria bacterium RIFOXYD2_FULL_34_120 TaxID=1798007 RepID=A0A1F5TRK2_9BACT|nr:MAG: hypothetical protein A2331_06580 [Candidatus Falkowbacteria bacterium RIFOXYB2_FULL_34_18]OGF30013.1 MAG: hypothetical protein A2500_04100 [Candidatus Falkowbacteria bacterium RIFOXYC12_FULL_34_55]OGF37130.1 MAG: hypothetical protein A2466_02420 [Candidatus Falkowbacteria bacterium RIFOXYC2_FULL_34_220]OGF39549.1 MAG: hypothetical protein A2515_04465 [Candidatus Falkowbacteria bacterium RIFOXYD12_FULL_34_57]OGF41468.1 MAG: hypothetical protein A2531_02135 [Candidatus Falkowbacteria bact